MGGSPDDVPIRQTPLHAAHVALGARMVPFAGYDMPVQYPLGILKEHLWTRAEAGLFDVSHMGQARLVGPDHETTARALEALTPVDALGLKPGQLRYTQLLNDGGGMLDDLIAGRPHSGSGRADGVLGIVVNAGCKAKDYAAISAALPRHVRLEVLDDLALVALQGPAAERVLGRLIPGTAALSFMTAAAFTWAGRPVTVSRSGYTGEDGFEISIAAAHVTDLWQALLGEPDVRPVGLGARDSLRLEAGLCLYGHELDESTSPVEAELIWSMPKRRRIEGGFPGADRIQAELKHGVRRTRVGLRPTGRAPAREGTEILSAAGDRIGVVTSGGFGPSIDAPIAMGYVIPGHAAPGTPVSLVVRGKPLPAEVVRLPFVPQRYKRAT